MTARGRRIERFRWSIASRIFVAQLLAVALLSGCLMLLLGLDSRASADDDASRLSVAVATTLAHDPFVIEAVKGADPSRGLQPYAVEVTDSAGVDFVTIMDTDGIRFTHPDPDEIGRTFLGTIDEALRGDVITETFTGTLGPSVRAVVPVIEDGTVIAIVSAGVTVDTVVASLGPRVPFVIGASALLVVIGSVGALLARRFLTRVTGSMLPSELSRMVSYYESVLHSVREGLILTDERGRVVLYNDEAAALLTLPSATGDTPPAPVSDLGLPPSLAQLIESGARAVDEPHIAGHRVLVVNQEPAAAPGGSGARSVGTLTTLRDRTEVNRLAGELESVRTLSDALRSQAHEYANRLHTVVALLELGRPQEAIDLIAQEVELSQALADDVLGAVEEPVLAALLLGKAAQAGERGIELRLDVDDALPASSLSAAELVSVVGNLIDNAIDAAVDGDAPGWVRLALQTNTERRMLELRVADSGRGVDPGQAARIFSRGVSSKSSGSGGRGYGLAVVREILTQRGGSIELKQEGGTEFVALWPAAERGAP